MHLINSRNIIGVMGSGSEPHSDLAAPVGNLIAKLGFHLLTGGGAGVMAETSRAFVQTEDRTGLCIGIIRGQSEEIQTNGRKRKYTPGAINPWVEIPVFTHLPYSGEKGCHMLSRNHINVLSSDVMIALPGGAGTWSEVKLRLEYGREVILFPGKAKIHDQDPERLQEFARRNKPVNLAGTIEELKSLIHAHLERYAL